MLILKTDDLTQDQENKIREAIEKIVTEGDLRRRVANDIKTITGNRLLQRLQA